MRRMLERTFEVDVPLQRVWDHLACVAAWPSWARHIREITVDPPGTLTDRTRGTIRLTNGIRSTFAMTELNAGRNWVWEGPLAWLTIRYDHRFAALATGHTQLTFVVEAHGFAVGSLGRLFAALYARNLDRAIPRLIDELEGRRGEPRD